MNSLLSAAAVFLASLALLLAAARFFTAAAERVGRALGMSSFAVGVIIVGVGTSLPELVSALVAARAGVTEIVSGNVLGANVANLLLILGASAMFSTVRPVVLGETYIAIDLHFLVGSAFLLGVVMHDGSVGAAEGGFLLAVYALYAYYLLREGSAPGDGGSTRDSVRTQDMAWLLGAGIGIYFGADWTVASLQDIAGGLGVSNALVSVTLLALGTTLPELAVGIGAARAGKAALAVGNILGSCVFNSLVAVGAATFVSPVVVPAELT